MRVRMVELGDERQNGVHVRLEHEARRFNDEVERMQRVRVDHWVGIVAQRRQNAWCPGGPTALPLRVLVNAPSPTRRPAFSLSRRAVPTVDCRCAETPVPPTCRRTQPSARMYPARVDGSPLFSTVSRRLLISDATKPAPIAVARRPIASAAATRCSGSDRMSGTCGAPARKATRPRVQASALGAGAARPTAPPRFFPSAGPAGALGCR